MKETVNYGVKRGNHSFAFTSDEMKTFKGILLVSGYCSVLHCLMYWQRQPDVYNQLNASSMEWDCFENMMKNVQAADNTMLPGNGRFAKNCPLSKILDGSIFHYGVVFGPVDTTTDEPMALYFGKHSTK